MFFQSLYLKYCNGLVTKHSIWIDIDFTGYLLSLHVITTLSLFFMTHKITDFPSLSTLVYLLILIAWFWPSVIVLLLSYLHLIVFGSTRQLPQLSLHTTVPCRPIVGVWRWWMSSLLIGVTTPCAKGKILSSGLGWCAAVLVLWSGRCSWHQALYHCWRFGHVMKQFIAVTR
jgi:hypothetical protein